jgi:capsular polysaccharide biosynthesis protein
VSTSDVYRSLWRHRFFIVLMTAALVGTTWFLTTQQEKQYTATSLVRVQQNITNATQAFGALQTGERLARTYAEIAKTSLVAAGVEEQLNGSVPLDQVRVKASQLDNLELLKLSVTNPNRFRAARIANAVPAALSAFIKSTGSLRDRITIVEPAVAPTSPSSPVLELNIAIALLLGLLLNSALALLLDSFSDRFDGAEELEALTGHTVIATIPTLKLSELVHSGTEYGQMSDSTEPLARARGSSG